MEWLFFHSQPHRRPHVRREVFVALSPHSLLAHVPKSVSDAVILRALRQNVFQILRPDSSSNSSRLVLFHSLVQRRKAFGRTEFMATRFVPFPHMR